jgi:hypothetical protein
MLAAGHLRGERGGLGDYREELNRLFNRTDLVLRAELDEHKTALDSTIP